MIKKILDFIYGKRKYVVLWTGKQYTTDVFCFGLAENGMGAHLWNFYKDSSNWIYFRSEKEAVKFMNKNCIEDKANYVIMELKDAN
jgi:hypothetical protein